MQRQTKGAPGAHGSSRPSPTVPPRPGVEPGAPDELEALRDENRYLRAELDRLRSAHLPGLASQALQQLAAQVPLGIVQWDTGLRVGAFSRQAEEILGWAAYQVVGKHVDEVPWLTEESRTQARVRLRELTAGRRPPRPGVVRSLRRDGTLVDCEWYETCLLGPDAVPSAMLSLVRDVSGRERAREALRRSEILCRAIAHRFPDGAVGVFDEDRRIVLHDGRSPCLAERPASIVGLRPMEFAPPGQGERLDALFREALAGREGHAAIPWRGRTMEVSAFPVRDEDGAVPLGLVVTRAP